MFDEARSSSRAHSLISKWPGVRWQGTMREKEPVALTEDYRNLQGGLELQKGGDQGNVTSGARSHSQHT
jgi:hypothetical protein